MADGLVLGLWDLPRAGVHHAVGDDEVARADGAGAGEVERAVGVEVRDDRVRVARGEEQADGAGQERVQLVEVLGEFGLGGVAEGDGHDFGFAEEDAADIKIHLSVLCSK